MLTATQAGTPVDLERIDARARDLTALTCAVEDRLDGLRPDGTDAPPPTVY